LNTLVYDYGYDGDDYDGNNDDDNDDDDYNDITHRPPHPPAL
jgi:hypothetical protein